MGWEQVAEEFLLAGDYEKLGEFYERAIAQSPDIISYYWYLSLAYLLQGKEAEAQGVWLSVFTEVEDEQLEDSTRELVEILDREASCQADRENYHQAWVIRSHIIEIYPNFIDNILLLIQLHIKLQTFQPNILAELEIIDLLLNKVEVNEGLLLDTLIQLVNYPHSDCLRFVEVSLGYVSDLGAAVEQIGAIATKFMMLPKKRSLYGLDLLNLCHQIQPDNLKIIKDLFWFNFYQKNYNQALEAAQEFINKSSTFAAQIFGNFQLISLYLKQAHWLEVEKLASSHKKLIQEMAWDQPKVKEDYLQESFILVAQPLLYLEDNPKENRPLQNQISRLFQQSLYPTTRSKKEITPKAKLRIGYIAHTLKRHSVGWLSRWLLHYHNKEAFEIALYLVNQAEDSLTEEWFKAKADIFYNFPANTAAIIQQIQEDEIDILIDLDSLTLNLTCKVLAAKPAPIQVTWLGLDASGLPAIDYFIADPYVLPENAQSYYQEEIWRLPHSYIAIDGFEVGVPTLRREDLNIPSEAIVYLVVQGGFKRHPDNIRTSMEIIKGVENSFLLIKGHADEEITRQLYCQIAHEVRLSSERLRFLPLDKTEEIHRANLAIADVVLDTYPYNGATTTLEVLWMGIPLVTRVGEQFAARNSYTFMLNAGLTEGIATTSEEYVEWGVKLGTDEELREEIVRKLRRSRETSPLWNAKQFTLKIEKAYEQMWHKYIEG